jgi:hypothetical protein
VSALWKTIAQLAGYSGFTHTPNYIDSDTPPVKLSLSPSFRTIVRQIAPEVGAVSILKLLGAVFRSAVSGH